jgi:queuine tRNA-ribosyltransferase
LVSVHNVAWTISLMNSMRDAISNGSFQALRRSILDIWG